MFHGVPMGYVILPNGEVAFDPDEQARSVMQMVFDKFDEIGTIYGLMHDLVRNQHRAARPLRSGPKKGELDWRRPSLATLCQLLHHPIYAGRMPTAGVRAIPRPSIRRPRIEARSGSRWTSGRCSSRTDCPPTSPGIATSRTRNG